MMCACDEDIGRQCLPHQLREGCELNTGCRISVTGGFLKHICDACRGLPIEAYPLASIHGRTSKISRYYWREIAFRAIELFAEWALSRGLSPIDDGSDKLKDIRKKFRDQAIAEIKKLHKRNPKYTYAKSTQAELISECEVSVLDIDAVYIKQASSKKSRLLFDGDSVTAEQYAVRYFEKDGFSTIYLESRPFHVLFGIYMWLLIQDPFDPNVRMVGFGDRFAFERGEVGGQIWMPLPEDFGKAGYARRRAGAIDKHLSVEMGERDHLLWLFDYWLPHSENLRQYLWAHRDEDIAAARSVVNVLAPECITQILRYLVEDYWGRYLGWPDLLVYRNHEYKFVEVKSSGDKLSDDQQRWIRDNHMRLNIPFQLVKLHKRSVREL